MIENKRRSAELLFDSIGMIDDRLITEAYAPPVISRSARRAVKLRPIVSVIFALIAATAVLFASLLASRFIGDKAADGNMDNISAEGSDPLSENDFSPRSLELTLMNASQSDRVTRVSEEELEFFGKPARLVWRFDGDEQYNVLDITSKNDLIKLKNSLLINSGNISPENSEKVGFSIWIVYSDGSVVSPHLKNSSGNTGFGELFDYSPEIEPNNDLEKLIRDLTS